MTQPSVPGSGAPPPLSNGPGLAPYPDKVARWVTDELIIPLL